MPKIGNAPSPSQANRVIVAVRLEFDDEFPESAHERAAKWNWQLIDLEMIGGVLGDLRPAAAIVQWLPGDARVEELRARGCKVVRLGRLTHPEDDTMPVVLPDYDGVGRKVSEYFLRKGYERQALVGHERMTIADTVSHAMLETLSDRGGTFLSYRYPQGFHRPRHTLFGRGDDGLKNWLMTTPKPLAVACFNKDAAYLSVLSQQAGFSVPEDLAILSLDGRRDACEMAPVALSSLDFNRAGQVEVAMQIVERLLSGAPVEPRTFVPPLDVVTRRSTDIVAVNDPTVARAVRFIWDHLDEDLSTEDIADAVHVSRRKLYRLFKEHFPRSVHEELQNARLQRTCQLLRSTDWTLETIAPQVGFSSTHYLHRAFSKAFDTTPLRYRQAHLNATTAEP